MQACQDNCCVRKKVPAGTAVYSQIDKPMPLRSQRKNYGKNDKMIFYNFGSLD